MGIKSTGFTIIESLLFLAVSGLMLVTMITVTSVTLNTQRYNDAVRSFQSLVQEQYARLSSTENDRPTEMRCGLDGTANPEEDVASTQLRGQSRCEIFGRYMTVQGGNVTIYPVLAYRDMSQQPSSGSDIALMTNPNYTKIGVDTSLGEATELEWGTEIAWTTAPQGGVDTRGSTGARSVALLFVRSPDSGQVYTFSSDTAVSNPADISGQVIRDMIVAGNTVPGQAARTLCVDSTGLVTNNSSSIFVNAFATGASSIETRTNDTFQAIGSEIRC